MPWALENVRNRSTRGSAGSIAGSEPAGAKSAYASSRQSSTSRDSALANASTAARVPPAAHRVVGVREEHEPRPLRPGQREQRVEILAVVAVACGHEPAAVADDVERERRIGAKRRDDRHARLDVQTRDDAEQRVDALADDHVAGVTPWRSAIACLRS